MLPQRIARRAAGDSGTVDSIRAGQPHRAHKRGRRSHRTWTRPTGSAREKERDRRAGDLPILLESPTRVSRTYLFSSSPLAASYFFPRRPHPSSQRRSTARDIPSRFPSAATTIIKLTVLKSDSRDVRMRHTRYTLDRRLRTLTDERSSNGSHVSRDLIRREAGCFRFERSKLLEKRRTYSFLYFSLLSNYKINRIKNPIKKLTKKLILINNLIKKY